MTEIIISLWYYTKTVCLCCLFGSSRQSKDVAYIYCIRMIKLLVPLLETSHFESCSISLNDIILESCFVTRPTPLLLYYFL